MKVYVARENVTFKISDVQRLLQASLDNIHSTDWKNAISHVIKVEADMRRLDAMVDNVVEPVIIHLGSVLQNQWNYLVATGKDQSTDNIKLAIVRNIIGAESARIMCTIAISDGTAEPYKYMMEQLEVYVNPRANKVFERYKFLSRNQTEGEPFEYYLTEVKHLVKSCNFNVTDPDETTEEKALRDRIVMGIRDTVTTEALLRIDINKAIEICRASKISKKQNKMFAEESIAEIHAIKRFPKDKHTSHTSRKQQDKFKCRRCQTMHGPRKYPAFGKSCSRCGILNHFAVACRVRNVENVDNQEKSDSDSDSCSSLEINNVNVSDQLRDLWDEIVEVENSKFKGFEGTQAKTVGTVSLHCKYKNKNIYENFVIVEGANKILLSGQACVDLGLLKRINRVNIKKCNNNVEKDQFIAEHHEIFFGYGRFEGTTKNFEAVSYPPTKVPFAIKDALKNELDRLVQRKAIVKVNEIDPRDSINRIVIVEKSNGTLRLSLDPQNLNDQIICGSGGAKFNKEKFQYCQRQVKFMGQVFSEKDMEIDPDRVESLCKLERPKDKTELQRIIGSFNYIRKYIPNMVEHIKPLCELLKSDVEFKWLPLQQRCFENLTEIITKSPALTPFDPKRKIILQCDTSKNGLGCCKNIHFADMLSRASLKVQENDPEMIEMVHSVSKHLPMSIEKRSELREFTSKDEILSKFFDYYFNGWPKENMLPANCKPYYKLKDNIFVEAGIVFLEDKIIVPTALRKNYMTIMHKGHLAPISFKMMRKFDIKKILSEKELEEIAEHFFDSEDDLDDPDFNEDDLGELNDNDLLSLPIEMEDFTRCR
ncbi:uncharacterized protein [Diabrotica undecimpunctata]|uniref:uncharacterized protein n=1 Tax=Diabrotica undecimpunctata TaxID=50387 RepID=UPI003B63E1B6